MRFLIKTTLLLILFFSVPAFSNNNFGLGVVLGDPTGISAKYVLNSTEAIDGALAFGGGGNIYLHTTWLISKETLFELDRYPVNWYYGIGARMISHDYDHDHNSFRHHNHSDRHENDFHAAVRAPVGLRMQFHDPRIELFTEIALALELVPKTDVDMDFGLGARYYF